jgi:hypothetical protein
MPTKEKGVLDVIEWAIGQPLNFPEKLNAVSDVSKRRKKKLPKRKRVRHRVHTRRD